MRARFVHLPGPAPYAAVHALQRALVAERIAGQIPDTILLVEHEETLTLGRRRTSADNVLLPDGVPVVEVERGGDVTWHGPGQLVAYPIVQLRGPRQDLHLHLHALEDAVIALLAELGVESGTDPRNTGVWIAGHKVCSIGIAARKWVTWHGLALNVDVDLRAFSRINPCGFPADIMTRLADHLAPCPDVTALAPRLAPHLGRALALDWDPAILRADGFDAAAVSALLTG